MVTDVEMGAMEGLKWLCKDEISKDILETAMDMLGELNTDEYYAMSSEEQNDYLQEYADAINNSVKDAVENDKLPKRMAADWEIMTSFPYGDREIFIGENPNPDKEIERYIVGDIVSNELFLRYENCMCSDSYNEAAGLYAKRMQEQIEKVQEKIDKFPYDRTVIQMDSCDSIRDVNITGEIVVINPKEIKPEYVGADRQLWLAQSGFGCSPEGSGRKVYCKNIFTGESGVWHRSDILGTLKADCVPQWVKDRMTDKGIEVLFTFGSSESFPFQMGYVSITAPTVELAIEEFRRNWPDKTVNCLNCADYYYLEDSVAQIKEHNNGGKCHKSIDITIPIIEGKAIDAILNDAKDRSGGSLISGKQSKIEIDM